VTAAAFETELPRTHEAPWLARRLLVQWFGAELGSDELHRAKLLASELVTNAVMHGVGRITLRAALNDDRALVEVIDEGSGFEHEIRHREVADLRGRGLGIVDTESSRWGVHEGTTHVWFELERDGPRLGTHSKPAT
jgi:anti-sigma regulatory factor (Ser/Thr protein kinase)